MSDVVEESRLDPEHFTLSDYGNVHITLPARSSVTAADVDAQLFEYVASAKRESGIMSVADIDDTWVQANFGTQGIASLTELRNAIKGDLERELNADYEELRFQRCMNAVLERLEGQIPPDAIDATVDASRSLYDSRLQAFGMTKGQYLHEQRLTEEEYEERLRDDVRDHMRLSVALDKFVEALGMTVGNNELTDYLTTDDPEAFVADLQRSGRVEEARQAAARVKAMRRVVETAVVEIEGGGGTEGDRA